MRQERPQLHAQADVGWEEKSVAKLPLPLDLPTHYLLFLLSLLLLLSPPTKEKQIFHQMRRGDEEKGEGGYFGVYHSPLSGALVPLSKSRSHSLYSPQHQRLLYDALHDLKVHLLVQP